MLFVGTEKWRFETVCYEVHKLSVGSSLSLSLCLLPRFPDHNPSCLGIGTFTPTRGQDSGPWSTFLSSPEMWRIEVFRFNPECPFQHSYTQSLLVLVSKLLFLGSSPYLTDGVRQLWGPYPSFIVSPLLSYWQVDNSYGLSHNDSNVGKGVTLRYEGKSIKGLMT